MECSHNVKFNLYFQTANKLSATKQLSKIHQSTALTVAPYQRNLPFNVAIKYFTSHSCYNLDHMRMRWKLTNCDFKFMRLSK